MNVLLVCAVGMSSSSLCKKVQTCVHARNLQEIKVGACGSNQAMNYAIQADMVMLAPQISYMKEALEKECFTKVYVLTPEIYGRQDAEKIVDWILDPSLVEVKDFSKAHLLYKTAELIGSNSVLRAISEGMTDILPVTVIGAISSLIYSFPLPLWQSLVTRFSIADFLDVLTQMTIGLISVYATLTISYHLAKRKGRNGTGIGLMAMVCFFAITGSIKESYLDLTYLGARGLLSGILVSIVIVYVFLFLEKILPHSQNLWIPTRIGLSFRAVLPGFGCVIVALLVCFIFQYVPSGTLPGFIDDLMSRYISQFVGTSGWSYLIVQFFSHLLWFFGIHGGQITSALTTPIYTQLSLENLAAFNAGEPLPYMVVKDVGHLYMFGGAGSTLALSILLAYGAKSKKLKSLGRLSLPMGIFFINEPVLFGLPMILNPILLVPFWGIPLICGILTFTCMRLGILPYMTGVSLPWTTPPIIYGLLQGSLRLALWQGLMLVLQLTMWYPFFRILDHTELKNESQNN